MFAKVVCCNATNSAAIDSDGGVWVWGAGRHGLLGMPPDKNQAWRVSKQASGKDGNQLIRKGNWTYPRKLTIEILKGSPEEKKLRDVFQSSDAIEIDVKEIAMGQLHMLVLGRDRAFHSDRRDFPSYAANILQELTAYLINLGNKIC